MARGKIKRNKGKGFKKFNKNRRHDKKSRKSSVKPVRKRDSSYMNEPGEQPREGAKRYKHMKQPENKLKVQVTTDDDSSEDEEDHFKQLLSTFSERYINDTTKAVESDSSSEDDAEGEAQNRKSSEDDDSSSESGNVSDNESLESVQEEVDDTLDPFVCHLHYDLDDNMIETLHTLPHSAEKVTQQWPVLGQLTAYLPKVKEEECKSIKPVVTLEREKQFAKPGTFPKRINRVNWTQLYVKSQIENNISKANFKNLSEKEKENSCPLTPLQMELFSIINNYQDLYYPERTFKNGEEIRFVYCLHAVNHILKTRTKIVHHNQKLTERNDTPDEYRDQGLARPKILILVPFRESALRVVNMIIEILFPDDKARVMKKKRYIDEFTGNELKMPKKCPRPEDYELLFAGNTDDTFRIGLSITKKSLKLYVDFYSADIIVASPLGLRVIIGAEGEQERDFDFLASIELLVLDQVDVFFMQNWDHLLHVLDHFHLQPQQARDTDFSRVRSWALNGWSRYYRQTLLFSSIMLPEFNALLNKRCQNYAGKISVTNPVPSGSISQVVVQVPQVFHRFEVSSVTEALDTRFDFFVKKILSQYKSAMMKHVLIYVPSYFDYVRLRNYFKKEGIGFVQICEYSKDGKVARARDMFYHGQVPFLLYSERHHFFRRPTIKGIYHILFYQPPVYSHFYSEMCNLMQERNLPKKSGSESNMTVTVLYSKYDAQQLAAIVGTERAARMVNSERNVHMFTTGK